MGNYFSCAIFTVHVCQYMKSLDISFFVNKIIERAKQIKNYRKNTIHKIINLKKEDKKLMGGNRIRTHRKKNLSCSKSSAVAHWAINGIQYIFISCNVSKYRSNHLYQLLFMSIEAAETE